jgi:dTDP-4-amino-4,6-dideoxygalactose transaminase
VLQRIFAAQAIFGNRARLMAEPNSGKRSCPHQSIIPQSAPGLRIARHRDEINAAIARVAGSSRYILGAECKGFEEEFARLLHAPFVIGVNSGTDALSLALLAVGVEPGQEVIVPALTAAATAIAVRRIGAIPRFVDVEPGTRGIDPTELAGAISSRTSAIVIVHLHGMPALLNDIRHIAAAHRLAVVEDCAHAHGATINGQFAGTLSDAAAFSFYPTKNLGALGDGGAVIVHSRDQAERVRRLRNYGQDPDGICMLDGMNSRLDEIQAAVLRVLLPHLLADNAQRRMHARFYDESLAPLVERSRVRLPQPDPGSVYHQYAIEVADRNRVHAKLLTLGIETAIHYSPGLHRHPGLNHTGFQADYPTTNRLSNTLLSLPIQNELMEHQPRIVEALITTLMVDAEDEIF